MKWQILEKLASETPKIEENLPPVNQSEKTGENEQNALDSAMLADEAREKLAGLVQDRQERKNYAGKSFRLVCRWLMGVFLLLVLQGFLSSGMNFWGIIISFKLPDSVLLAIVGGTTASVIGIFLVVANYLFPKR